MVDRYVLHHSRYLEMPLVWIHKPAAKPGQVMIWLGENGKASEKDWPDLKQYIDSGMDVVSLDPRGLGETRMRYKAVSADDPTLAQMDFDHAYVNPLSSVLAGYVYNSILTGRPYFLQMIEDVEVTARFVREKSAFSTQLSVSGKGNGYTLASAASEALPNVKLVSGPGAQAMRWSDVVEQKRELWPIEELLPGGAYIH